MCLTNVLSFFEDTLHMISRKLLGGDPNDLSDWLTTLWRRSSSNLLNCFIIPLDCGWNGVVCVFQISNRLQMPLKTAVLKFFAWWSVTSGTPNVLNTFLASAHVTVDASWLGDKLQATYEIIHGNQQLQLSFQGAHLHCIASWDPCLWSWVLWLIHTGTLTTPCPSHYEFLRLI